MVIGTIIATVLASTIAPIFVSQLLTSVVNGSATLNNSIMLLVSYSVLLLAGDVVTFRFVIAAAYISETKMQANVASRVLQHLVSKSMGYHANKMTGSTISNTSKLNGSIERFWDMIIFTVIPIITTIVSVCIVLSFMIWQFAVIILTLSIIIIVIIIKSQIAMAPISENASNKSSDTTAYFSDVVGNISTVKAFSNDKSEIKQHQKLIEIWRQASLKEMKSVLLITGSFGTLMVIMNACAFAMAIYATQYKIANIGTIYLIISYTLNVVHQLWSVSNATRTFVRVIGDASPMIGTLDEPIEIKDPIDPKPFTVSSGKIEFDKVTFTHADNDSSLFSEFTLTVKPGEQVGLVGRSGSGKTSLTQLLLRFCDVDSGRVLIDDTDITNITQNDLRQSIAYVSQEPVLFHRTLRENIAYSKPSATDDEIRHAADQANALEFINVLPKGLDTIVGERGVKLSGGQRQRIVIARAILKDAPILVLDEATSALDSESEKLIQSALVKLMKGRTSIVIAHRLSTISKLDRIIVLDNGKIVEQGSHTKLLSNNGIYAKLWSHQSGGFIEE